MNILNGVNGTMKIVMVCLVLLLGFDAVGQGASLSPYDLKESYLEKRMRYESSATKKIAAENQQELDRLVRVLEENAPNSYEFHLVKYINGNFDLSLKDHLFKAYELKPDEQQVKREMFGYYALTENNGKQKEFAKLIEASYTQNTLNYYKLLTSNSKIKTLFLSGEADAYPVLVLQSLGKIRKDIELINLDFLLNDKYRMRVQNRIGMSNTPFAGQEHLFIHAANAALSSGVYFSSTISQKYLRKQADQYFLTGLYYQYKCANQLAELEAFWKNGQQSLNGLSLKSSTEKRLYSNFLPPLLTLYKIKMEQAEKDAPLRKDIQTLAKKVGKESAVEEILKVYDQIE